MRNRYTSVAISLHWLIAILLVGLIAIGKYLDELEETDHFRFELIQWHKSFGILVLLLVLIRIGWRLAHRPPRLSGAMPKLERFAASATHAFMYLLMLAIPLSGWIMVSASPLNLATELFGSIPWPHLPLTSAFGLGEAGKESLSELSHQVHQLLANALLILVLLHIAAALRHQFLLKDNLLSRMWVAEEHRRHRDLNHAMIPGLLLVGAIGFFLWDKVSTEGSRAASSSGNAVATVVSGVGFTATQLGAPVDGTFDDVTIELAIKTSAIDASVLNATVQTSSVNTGDGQIDSTVVTGNWFASDQFPAATFRSTGFARHAESGAYSVTGDLTIRDISRAINFVLYLDNGIAKGEFSIDRADYGIGTGGQDEFIESEVVIRFETPH